jgi:hypothetical protein
MNRPLMTCLTALALLDAAHASTTLLTITCDKPAGLLTAYGITTADLTDVLGKNLPIPEPKFYPPHQDWFGKTTITLRSDATATVVFDYGKTLGGADTHDVQLLGGLNDTAVTFLEDNSPLGEGARLITFYPQQRVAFFTGNTYSGYVWKDRGNAATLESYSFFARCEFDGMDRLRWAMRNMSRKH